MENLTKAQQMLASPEFKKLVKIRWSVALTLTVVMLAVYLGFIFIVAFAKDFLAIKLGSHVNLGLLLGLGIILFTWVITGVYVYWANNYYDKEVNNIKKRL
jgi:uncharacterized membrane protein (DUF485 family)